MMVSLKDWGVEFWMLLCCSYNLQGTGVSRGRFLFSEHTVAACWYAQLRKAVKYILFSQYTRLLKAPIRLQPVLPHKCRKA